MISFKSFLGWTEILCKKKKNTYRNATKAMIGKEDEKVNYTGRRDFRINSAKSPPLFFRKRKRNGSWLLILENFHPKKNNNNKDRK